MEVQHHIETQIPAATRGGAAPGRLDFLDWTRGAAAAIMLQGHVFHSFLRSDLRTGDAFILSQFVGGLPPAIFLFLTGITLAFLMDSSERRGLNGFERVKASLLRARYLLLLAVAFRFQLWLFAYPQSHWTALFRVDILNCMGVGMLALALVVGLPFMGANAGALLGMLVGYGAAALVWWRGRLRARELFGVLLLAAIVLGATLLIDLSRSGGSQTHIARAMLSGGSETKKSVPPAIVSVVTINSCPARAGKIATSSLRPKAPSPANGAK